MFGRYNIALGYAAGYNLTDGDNNIVIGNVGAATDYGMIRIGTPGTQSATFIAGICGVTFPGQVPVYVNAAGQLGTAPSSRRYKVEIQDMGDASAVLYALEPVTFRYKPELDPNGTPQFGLVAEEVARVAPDLVVRDEQGRIYTVRYDSINSMLLNEFLREHRRFEAQQAEIASLKEKAARLDALEERLNHLEQTVQNLLATKGGGR